MNGWSDRDEFRRRVQEWAAKLDIEVTSVSIRPMRRKWASCSTNGRLNFNDELLQMDREIGDYVIPTTCCISSRQTMAGCGRC